MCFRPPTVIRNAARLCRNGPGRYIRLPCHGGRRTKRLHPGRISCRTELPGRVRYRVSLETERLAWDRWFSANQNTAEESLYYKVIRFRTADTGGISVRLLRSILSSPTRFDCVRTDSADFICHRFRRPFILYIGVLSGHRISWVGGAVGVSMKTGRPLLSQVCG